MLTVHVAFVFDECALVSDAATATAASSVISGFSFPEQLLGTAVGSFPRPVAFLGVAATAVSVDFWSHGKSLSEWYGRIALITGVKFKFCLIFTFCGLAPWLLLLRREFSSSSAMGLRL